MLSMLQTNFHSPQLCQGRGKTIKSLVKSASIFKNKALKGKVVGDICIYILFIMVNQSFKISLHALLKQIFAQQPSVFFKVNISFYFKFSVSMAAAQFPLSSRQSLLLALKFQFSLKAN